MCVSISFPWISEYLLCQPHNLEGDPVDDLKFEVMYVVSCFQVVSWDWKVCACVPYIILILGDSILAFLCGLPSIAQAAWALNQIHYVIRMACIMSMNGKCASCSGMCKGTVAPFWMLLQWAHPKQGKVPSLWLPVVVCWTSRPSDPGSALVSLLITASVVGHHRELWKKGRVPLSQYVPAHVNSFFYVLGIGCKRRDTDDLGAVSHCSFRCSVQEWVAR